MGMDKLFVSNSDQQMDLTWPDTNQDDVSRDQRPGDGSQAIVDNVSAQFGQEAVAQHIAIRQTRCRSAGGERCGQHAYTIKPRSWITTVQAKRRSDQRQGLGCQIVPVPCGACHCDTCHWGGG